MTGDSDEEQLEREDMALADEGWKPCDPLGHRWRDPDGGIVVTREEALRRLASDLAKGNLA